ncbi:succinylglutamate desuccinylase/aspartoacylase family protein [Croceicoccus mobilis]|uniref:Deacylase n=1 Tax=Croceicoccus mobilis TaxID=1703339 RepID=A0A916Z3V7_9SPHN|nr:succinylglutamate desuccinylase/aspartoacylase family protein [Croceicoccus mobilis]GGD72451.1 deacylase [Croceicoccus mobilis]
MNVAGHTLEPGEKIEFDLPAGETALRKVTVPVTAIRGAQDGPTIAITAACHPMELNGVLIAAKVAKMIDPAKLKGTVLIVHVQNVMGFEHKKGHASPLDGVNFGKAFPVAGVTVEGTGNVSHQGTSLSFSTAQAVWDHIIAPADMLIDLHGGELFESLKENIEILTVADDETNERSREFARAFLFDEIWEVPQGSIPEMPSYPERGGAVMEAMKAGKPAVYCEVGSEGHLDEALVDKTVAGIDNVFKKYGMIAGEAQERPVRTYVGGHVLFATRGGLFLNRTKAGQEVTEGEVLGTILDIKGEVLEEIRAPGHCVVSNTIVLGIANPGDMLYVMGNVV